MAEEFTGSLTPPVSPYLTDSAAEDSCEDCRPPRFTCAPTACRDGGKLFSDDSYLTTGSLKRLLLKLDPSPTDYETDTVDIFGFQWVTETALVESISLLFGLLRQKINELEGLTQPISFDLGQANNIHNEAEEIRNECTKSLQYVKVFLYRFLDSSRQIEDMLAHSYEEMDAELPSKLIEELNGLSLYIGAFSNLPHHIIGAFSMQHHGKVCQIVYAHQYINLIGENLTNVSLFEEHCDNLLCSLISLAATKYSKVRPSEALSSGIYLCPCIKEMWTLLIQLLDHKGKGSSTESFWTLLNTLLRHLLQRSGGTGEHPICTMVQCKDPLGFCWWLISHLSSLYLLDRNGITEEKVEKTSNWKFVEDLLKKSSDTQHGILEDQLRMQLQCCLSLCDIWEPNLTVVTILWEYYSNNLNCLFNISWLGLKSLASVSKTPLSMLEVVKNCCADEQSPDLYKSDNSYLIFLRIMARLMKKAKCSVGAHPWKQIKGRIYSKFHQRKMQQLTEVGLQNFFTLFLLLANLAETEDVTSRILDLLNFLVPSKLSSAQQTLVWRGNFAFILIYVEKNMDISVLAEKISHSFRETAKEFLVSKGDYGQKHTHWNLLSTYVDGVEEVFETSCRLDLSEEKLLNDGFSMLLPACRESELSAVIHLLQTAIARLRNIHSRSVQGHGNAGIHAAKERHLAVASALWRNFFPFLKSLRLSQTPPSQLADTAAGYTLLALDVPSSALPDLQPQPFVSMMQLFGWDDMVAPQLVSRYLSHLIPNSALTEVLNGIGYSSHQALSIRAWIRCVLQMYIDLPVGSVLAEQLVEFTRLVFKLPEAKHILTKAQIEHTSYKQDPRQALLQFIKAAGTTYGGLQTLSEKSKMVSKCQEYIGDILKYVKPYLTKRGPVEGLQICYRTMGKCCCWGLSIISRHSQAQGAYIKQQLKMIIQQYFGRFLPSAAPVSGSHPVLLALCESVQSTYTTNLRRIVMEVIRDDYLQFKAHAPPPRLATILSFIVDVFQRTM
ncbi:hypothetical protein GDO78_001269 [Eleutherodactylus coqui]|nr:hypothetical protein GDO78_001269 [Eleutherodactylus coqui]